MRTPIFQNPMDAMFWRLEYNRQMENGAVVDEAISVADRALVALQDRDRAYNNALTVRDPHKFESVV